MSDDALRAFVYDHIIVRGAVPPSSEIAAYFDGDAAQVRDRLAALEVGKTILVHPATHEIWMAGPFSAAPTQYKLSDGKTTWYANCAWDMLGVAMLVDRPLLAETHCADCGERIAVECDPLHPPSECQAVVHFLVPARQWYDDIGFT
jgi:hypothetical protein